MIFDPLFLGNAALFAAVLGGSLLDFSSLFGSNEDEDEDSAVQDDDAPVAPPSDLIQGTEGPDDLAGAGGDPGNFVLLGGDDTLDAGDFDDTISAGTGDDEIFGRLGDDSIALGDDDDRGMGGFGNDSIFGDEGEDQIVGQSGDDSLDGGSGNDLVSGGKDSDYVFGGNGNDILYGGEGADTVLGGAGDDMLNGTYEDTTQSQTVSPDLADTLDGGAGDDELLLGSGDLATGGEGSDTFVIDDYVVEQGLDGDEITPPSPTIITDFDPAEDILVIEYDAGASPGVVGLTSTPSATGLVVSLDGVDLAILDGISDYPVEQVQLVAI